MIRRTYPLELAGEPLGPRQVRVRASTGNLGRDGLIVHPAGIDLTHYRKNPVMLWQHDPAAPVARAIMLGMEGDDLCADVEFAPEGVSAKADEICGLVKAGVVNAVSIGFDPQETEPLDPKRPRGGQRVLRSELMEISFVSVPADREAVVLQRKKDVLKGILAVSEIREEEGLGDFVQQFDRASDKPKGDYGDVEYADPGYQEDKKPRYPIDTEEHIKAARDYIAEAKNQEPYSANEVDRIKAKIVAAAWKGAWKEKIDKDEPPSARAATPVLRGMYGVGQLAYLMEGLADAQWMAEVESELEGDESKVPAMLTTALQNLGAALKAMTAEEVAELIGGEEVDVDQEVALGAANAVMTIAMAAKTPAKRDYYLGKHSMTRAGAKHSAETMRSMEPADVTGSQKIQKSGGTAQDEGSRAVLTLAVRGGDLPARQRQVELLALRGIALSRQ